MNTPTSLAECEKRACNRRDSASSL